MTNTMSSQDYKDKFVKPALDQDEDDRTFAHAVIRDTKIGKTRSNEEDELTKAIANYLEGLIKKKKVVCFSHIPNSTYTKYWGVKTKNKAMGVRPGVPDMLIVFPSDILFLELKREKGGVVRDTQKRWIEALVGTGKVHACVAEGEEEAKKVIDEIAYLTYVGQ